MTRGRPAAVAVVAPLLFVLLWSSSFITTKVGLEHLSPLLFVAVRLSACALVLAAFMLVLHRSWRSLSEGKWLHCALAGALLNAVGLMGPHVGLQIAPAAQIALVQSLTPLLTAVSGVVLLNERLRSVQWGGLALGVMGVALIVGEAAIESATRLDGLALAFVGVLGLVAGTLYFGQFCRGVPFLPGATAQFAGAAVVSSFGAWLLETPHADWTGTAIAAVAWNIVMVSLGGMGLYSVMLVHGTVARTSANFYLIPGTVALVAWLLLGERPSPFVLFGILIASVGCWLVSASPGFGRDTPSSDDRSTAD